MKLESVRPAGDGIHKYVATFENEGRKKKTKFGAAGMSDFTKTHDTEQRARYRKRHAKDLNTGDPTRAGFLSWHLLWNKTSMAESIKDYKRRFDM